MPTKPKDVLKTILDYDDNAGSNFRKWFLKQFKTTNDATCSLDEFAAYYINSLRQYTDHHVKASCGTDTPKCQTPVRTFKADATREDSTATPRRLMLDLQQQDTSTPNRSLHNDSMSQKSVSADWGSHSVRRLSTSADRSEFSQRHDSSTPIKRNVSSNSKRLSTTPNSSLCLGDFLVKNTSNNRSHRKKNTSATSMNQQQNEKPKKRVQPISVSRKTQTLNNSSSIFMGESSFSNENNILKISHSEVEDREQCAIQAARKTLKSNAIEITKELVVSPMKTSAAAVDQAQMTTSTPSKQDSVAESFAQEASLNLQNLENKTLQRLADIYVILIELNLTTNFLNELSFLLNLLNASWSSNDNKLADAFTQLEIQDDDDEECPRIMSSLQDFNMSVCFALLCLNQQKYLLASLDSRTIKVVISSERFSYLKEDVRAFVLDIYQKKQQLLTESPGQDSSFCFTHTKPSTNVYFQQDQDSRQNFSSLQEFANFRPQRDLFYKCLKTWETNHLNPNWKFSVEIAPIIREIFQQSEHFVNMAHFAKLFVSQLLLSASNASSPEEMGLDVDMQKFSRLTQRLIAPSQFSVDYQFPRAQAFFRDFILIARSLAFAEQLKMVLYSELMSLNDSSYDHISVTKIEDDHDNPDKSLIAYCSNDQMAVRPEILNSTLILAKFFGFTISLPYTFNTNGNNVITTTVEEKQLHLRNLIQPNIDLHLVVKTSIEEGKLLITIPWVVQYISMLDSITLQLEVHTKVLNLLFAVHWYLARYGARALHTTSKFIITACLSWLFDSKQFITEQYYNFRSEIIKNSNSHDMELIKSKLENPTVEGKTSSSEFELNPILESLLPVACPFLGEFRVSIMPAKYAQTKYASRTGRYRHITTRIADVSSPTDKDNSTVVHSKSNQPINIQQHLTQAFYQSQNSSTRQLISFCSERCYKSVVKDGQLKILLPAKSKADAKVNKIDSCDFRIVFKEVCVIYREAHQEAYTEWKENVPKMLDKRIQTSLDSLLPEETSQILKKTYFMIIKKDAKKKISNWFYANIIKDNYFCVELRSLANKISAANESPKQPSELKIIDDSPRVSELLASLQYWLHCTSVRNDLFDDSKPIVDLLQGLNEAFKNVLPSILYRLVATYTVQLMQQIITSSCAHLTTELIEAACQVWLHPNMQLALNLSKSRKVTNSNKFKVCIYQSLVTVAFLQTIGNKTECYNKYGQLIIAMITNGVISLKFTNELFVPIFKNDWHPSQLNEISNMLRNIAQATTKSVSVSCALDDEEEEEDDEKSNLFMDMLADLSRDIDFF